MASEANTDRAIALWDQAMSPENAHDIPVTPLADALDRAEQSGYERGRASQDAEVQELVRALRDLLKYPLTRCGCEAPDPHYIRMGLCPHCVARSLLARYDRPGITGETDRNPADKTGGSGGWTPWSESPTCPWCGDELTNDPHDLDPGAFSQLDCNGCGQPVTVEGMWRPPVYRAMKNEEAEHV